MDLLDIANTFCDAFDFCGILGCNRTKIAKQDFTCETCGKLIQAGSEYTQCGFIFRHKYHNECYKE
jgi:hypothetical protein